MFLEIQTDFEREMVAGSIVSNLSLDQAQALRYTPTSEALPDFNTLVVFKCANKTGWKDGRPAIHYRLGRRKQLQPDQGRGWCWQYGAWLEENEVEGWAYYQPLDPFNL